MKNQFSLFKGYGVEIEYMIVDKTTLKVKPICNEVIKQMTGAEVWEVPRGKITWSAEVAQHVIELKLTSPETDLSRIHELFFAQIEPLNILLADWNCQLLPTGSHPFMDPTIETVLFTQDYEEIYAMIHSVHNCYRHGFGNVQSTHINYAFSTDQEFETLLAGLRVLMPLLPVLSASSPFLDGEKTPFFDARVNEIMYNQIAVPATLGTFITEPYFSPQEYIEKLYPPMLAQMDVFDPERITSNGDAHDLDSRAARLRSYGSIELRLLDTQESIKMETALIVFITEVLKEIASENISPLATQKRLDSDYLRSVLIETITIGGKCIISNQEYLNCFGFHTAVSAQEIWESLYSRVEPTLTLEIAQNIKKILSRGNLAQRILKAYSTNSIHEIYSNLAECLKSDQFFDT